MSYVPKSLVNANLYTGGDEFTTTSGEPYVGYYHQLFNNDVSSGKTPNDPNSVPLIQNFSENPINNYIVQTKENIEYSIIQPVNQALYQSSGDPLFTYPTLTGKDYQRGQILRYFAKKRNETVPKIIEISKEAYEDLNINGGRYNYALWTVTRVFWKITGSLRDSINSSGIKTSGIIDTNKRLVDTAEETFKGIKQYLSNLIQFAVKSELELINGLYTGGDELTNLKDNSNYIGYYHIMANKKIMDGSTHKQSTGIVLLAANYLVTDSINSLIQQSLGEIGIKTDVDTTNNSRTLPAQSEVNISDTPIVRQPSAPIIRQSSSGGGGGSGGY